MLPFVKTEALGNDFILVEESSAGERNRRNLSIAICNRRQGVGADGLILWKHGLDSFDVEIFNSDGSQAECSGNGLRCLAAHLFQAGHAPGAAVRLKTVSGTYALRRVGDRYTADMGVPSLSPNDIPFRGGEALQRVVDYPLDVDGQQLRVTACATGNPHCSLFVDTIDLALVEMLGPKLESHPAFPNRTNVEFIRVRNAREIEVAFWERGAGLTPASGTGSCGATVACVLTGRTDRKIVVHAQYGSLEVDWGADDRLTLTAGARVVAEGYYKVETTEPVGSTAR